MANNVVAALASLKIDRTAVPRRPGGGRRWRLVAAGAALLVASSVAVSAAKPYLEAMVLTTTVTTTQVTVFSPIQAAVELSASGYVKPESVSRVAPKVPGLVCAVHVDQGERVGINQLLFELSPDDDRANARAAASDTEASRAAAESARARAVVAQSELDEAVVRAARERRLAQDGVAPSGNADDLEARAASLKQRVAAAAAEAQAADAQTKALGARARAMNIGLHNLLIVSPIAGTVINKPPQLGEYIAPQFAAGVRIADLTQLTVEADVPEARLGAIKRGAPAEISLDAYPDKRFRAQVKEVLPEVDRSKATVSVKVAFLDDTDGVLPEMSARVSFLTEKVEETKRQPDKKVVSEKAVVERGGARVVFLLEGDRVRVRPVKLGLKLDTNFELLEGPPAGAEVVLSPSPGLTDGQRVKANSH